MRNIPNQTSLEALQSRISSATGKDRELDLLISMTLNGQDGSEKVPDYTSSIEVCLTLIKDALPGWHWHLGHGPDGILPYATMRKQDSVDDGSATSVGASAATVQLALLHAMVKALMTEMAQ